MNFNREDIPHGCDGACGEDDISGNALIPYEDGIADKELRSRRAWIILLICSVIFAAVTVGAVFFSLHSEKSEGGTVSDDAIPSDTVAEEWSGAFASAEISQECLAACVSLRLGPVGEYGAPSSTGFFVSSDGWILSSDSLLQSTQRGRLYARLFDGREYAVQKAVRFRDISMALMKIDVEDATCARMGSTRGLTVGQSVVAVSSTGAPCHDLALSGGIISNTDHSVWQGYGMQTGTAVLTDIFFDGISMGSPIFDKNGMLVGVALYENQKIILPIDEIRDEIDGVK